jgi:hypothetical protein
LAPLNACTKVFVPSILLPPAAISVTSILTDVQPAGVVKLYHTSYVVPQVLGIPELVARYRVPEVLLQVVAGVRGVGLAQLSDWAKSLRGRLRKTKAAHSNAMVRWVVGRMVLKDLNFKNQVKLISNTYSLYSNCS